MNEVFLAILNMSLTGAFIIAAICLVRLPLKKAPKIISYCLWAIAGFRLIIPVSVESMFSLIPFKAKTIPYDIALQPEPHINSGILYLNQAISDMLPAAAPKSEVNPLHHWITAGWIVWLSGALMLLAYGVVSYIILRNHMKKAVHINDNIYEAEDLKSPFVQGFLRPKIYLPDGLSQREHQYIILHEQTHIKRRDHIVKMAAYVILCLHWFNPLVWAAFLLMGADMEMACDERVLGEMGTEIKKEYSSSILSLATDGRIIGGSPLAFGEGGIKERIKNVLNFKKPSRIVIIAAVVLVMILSMGFVMNRTMGPSGDEGSIPLNMGSAKTYYLENPTEKEKFERLSSVTLFNNGKAMLATPMISSYILPACTYSFAEEELIIYADIENDQQEDFFGVGHGNEIARFKADDHALEFMYAQVPLFADMGARYILKHTLPVPVSDFEMRQLVFENSDSESFWSVANEFMLEEFPDVLFKYSWGAVTAADERGERTLFGGMPIWNVYLADLNGDGLPEFCGNVSIGSGIIDSRIAIYDYANDKCYELSDRMVYDYSLSIENGQLLVTQQKYMDNTEQAVGTIAIIDGELVLFGIERALAE